MVSFSDLISGFISTPGQIFNYVQENIVRSPKPLKRRRDESTDGAEQSQRVARLKVSLPEPEDKAASRLATLSGNTPHHRADRQLAAGEVVSPPAALLQRQKQTQTQALKQQPWARNSALKEQSGAAGATPTQPLELWSTIRARRHGPQTRFRPFRNLATPAQAAKSPSMEEHRVRQKILDELRAAGQADEDADVKAKQAEAKRAALLYKLKQAEFAAGMSTPQPLGRQMEGLDGGQLPRRLDMSASAAPWQAATPAGQQAPLHAQPTPSGAFFASATPLEAQQERAMRQVLQEQEETDLRAQEMARSKAAYEESKARLKQAEEKVRMVCEKARRVMEGTDPVSSSRRSMQTALAMEIKLAEEERRRLEAQRHDRLLSYAAAQPLPDEAVPAPGVQGVLRRKESLRDSASSQQHQQKQAPRPSAAAQAKAKAVPKQQEEEAIVLLSSDDEEEEQEEEQRDEEDETEEEEEESALNEELEHVRVDNEVALRQLSKRHRALAAKGLGPGPAEEIVAYHKPSNIEMPRRLLRCLNGLDWLNDEVINIYMGLLQVRDADRRRAGLGPKCHFFNSFFVNKLWKDAGMYCYANVARWTAQKKLEKQGQMSATILEVDRVIMPVHLGNHWTCAVIDLAAQELVYYDSMGGRHMDIMKALRQYVADEYENKTSKCVDTSKWKIRFPIDIPYQTNGSDCGIFALQYAEHVSRNASFDFDQQDMPYFRLKIAADIMSLNIL